MSIKGIIFDLDGTLADTMPDLTDAINVGLKALGFPERPRSDVRGWIGEGLPVLCRRAVDHDPDVPIDEMAAIITQHYRRHRLDTTVPFVGIPELLDALSQSQVPLAVLSNKPHEHTQPMIDALFARWSFVAVEGYREEAFRKPDPRTALRIVQQMRLPPASVALVGDSGTDVMTARNAGLVPIGVTWGYRDRDELVDAGVAYTIDHPAQLLALV